MKSRFISLMALGLLALSGVASAQEEEQAPPVQVGPYNFFGNVSAGYRATSVSGLNGEATTPWTDLGFNQQYNLRSGLNAFAINLFGERPQEKEGFFDQFLLSASNNGPFLDGSLRLRRFGAFDFNVNYKRADYFYDRFDSVTVDMHESDYTRDILNANLSIQATPIFGIDLGYNGTGRTGDYLGTEALTVRGDSVLNRFPLTPKYTARRYFYYKRQNVFRTSTPRDDWSNDFFGRINATLPMVNVALGGGIRTNSEMLHAKQLGTVPLNYRDPAGVNEWGIIGDNRLKESLDALHLNDDRETTTPYFFGEVVAKPADWISLTARGRMDRLSGTSTLSNFQQGKIRYDTSSTNPALQTYRADQNGELHFDHDQLNASFNATIRPMKGLRLNAMYRFEQVERDLEAKYTIAIDTMAIGGTSWVKANRNDSLAINEESRTFKIPTQTISAQASYAPMSMLSLRVGYGISMKKPEVREFEHGELNERFSAALSKETKRSNLMASLFFRPIDELRFRARFENASAEAFAEGTDSVVDFTPRLTPESRLGTSFSLEGEPMTGLSGSIRLGISKNTSELTMPGVTGIPEMTNDLKSLAGGFNYEIMPGMSVLLNGEYRENNFSIPMQWSSGPFIPNPPLGVSKADSLTVLVTQNTIDRFYDLSVAARPIDGLNLTVGGSYLRSTGGPYVTKEVVTKNSPGDIVRIGGPFTKYEIKGRVAYDITRNIGAAVDGLYSVMDEDEVGTFVALNNFSGSAITFSLQYSF